MFLLCDASCVIPLKDVFQKLPRNCVVSWTSLIGHCASQGHKVDAALLFSMIEAKGIPPNTFTLLVVLTACKRSGLVDDGRKRLENMIKAYSLVLGVQLYACVVDLFGRAGCLLEAMTTRTTPKKQLSKHKFSLGISEANLESHMLEVTQMEFILKIRGRIQLPLDRFIRELKLGDLEKAQLDLKATTHGAPLFASGTPPIIIYALKAFLLEFESHLNSEMIDFEVLADDYRYSKTTLNGYALFQNIQWSEMHVLHAAELPKFLPAYLNTFTCYVAADTLLAHESFTRVPESYHSVLALQLGFFLKLHICSVATVSLLLPLVRVIKWPNQDSSYVPIRGATHVLLQGAAIRFVLVVVPNMYHACSDNDFSRHLGIVIAYAQLNFEGEKSSKTMTEAFKVGETPRKGQQVQVLAVFIIRQPITLEWVYLRTLDHATLPNALCFALLQLHSYLHELGLCTHMHELNYLFMTSWAYIICALLLSATTTGMEDSTRGNPSLLAMVVCHFPCRCQPRWSFVDKVIASVNNISELSFLRYYYAPPLPRDYGVFPLTYMNKCFPYMVSHVHQDMFLRVTHSSTFYSPFYALVRKLVPLSLMAAIQLLGSLLANILRDHYIIGILVLKSIIQLVSLKSIQHGLEVSYGAISTGNYSSHVSCLIYFPEFMNTWDWVIDFGFVAIDFGYLALIPSLHLSLPTRSIEALLLFVWPTIMHCQIVELVISCTLLQSPNGDTTLLHSTCDFKADVIPLVPDFIVIWLNITVSDRFWGTMAKRDTASEFQTTRNDYLTASATQGRSGVFMQLKLHYFELLELVKTPTNSSPSTSYLLQFLSKTWSQVILPFFAYTLIPWLVLLDASVDCSFPKKLGSEEKVACADITKGSPKVNDSVAEGVLQCLEEILMQYLLVFVYQMVVVLTMLTYGALFSSFDSSEEIPLGVTKCFRALLLKFFACSFKSCTYDLESLVLGSRSIVANDKIMEDIVREDNPSAGFTCFLLIDLYNNTADVKELKSYCQDASRINAKSIPGIPTASVTSGLTDIAATSMTSLNELKQTVELLQKPFKLPTDDPGQQNFETLKLEDKLVFKGGGLVRIIPIYLDHTVGLGLTNRSVG